MLLIPNPASDAGFHVQLNAGTGKATHQFRDLTDRVLYSREMRTGEEAEIDGKALGMKAGIYLIRLKAR